MILMLGQAVLTLALYVFGAVVIGTALVPGVWLCYVLWLATADWSVALRLWAVCVAGAGAYFVFGLSLLLVTWLMRLLFGLRLKEGTHPMASLETIRWMVSNALQLVVWSTFGDFLLLTPFAALFYHLMGAKLGRNVQINSAFCADLELLEIGDGSIIGGHATVIAHAFEPAGLILKRVKIGRHVVVGLNAVILPGADIGDGAVIAAGAIVPKHTVIPPGTVYLGAHARN